MKKLLLLGIALLLVVSMVSFVSAVKNGDKCTTVDAKACSDDFASRCLCTQTLSSYVGIGSPKWNCNIGGGKPSFGISYCFNGMCDPTTVTCVEKGIDNSNTKSGKAYGKSEGSACSDCNDGYKYCISDSKLCTYQNGKLSPCENCGTQGKVCVSGGILSDKCVTKTIHCNPNGNDCPSGYLCDKTTLLCEYDSCAGVSCGPGEICENGNCRTDYDCDFKKSNPTDYTNPDCPNDKPVCGPLGSNGKWICVECAIDTNCPTGKFCDGATGTCMDTPKQSKFKAPSVKYPSSDKAKIAISLFGCDDLSGTISYDGEKANVNNQGVANIEVERPKFGETKELTFTFNPNSKKCLGTTSNPIKIKANDECSPTEFYILGKSNNCKCEGAIQSKGACCYGKWEKIGKDGKEFKNEKQCKKSKPIINDDGTVIKTKNMPKCKKQNEFSTAEKYPKGCKCGDNIFDPTGPSKICCNYGERPLVDSLDKCPSPNCNSKCDAINSFSADKCICPNYCNKKEVSQNDKDKTCGAYKPNSMCIRYGDCMTPAVCKERKGTEEPNYLDSCKEKGSICCTFNGDNQTTELFRCTDVCKDVNGCTCPGDCKDKDGILIKGKVPKGNTCNNVFVKSNEANSACSGFDRESKDNVCPPGCFWFNDFDCGVDKNIGNVLWDFVKKGDWLNWYTKDYQNFMRDLGAKFDIMTWAESICNPMNSVSPSSKDFEDGELISTNKLVGWIGAESSQYNTSTSVYTISWFLANLPKDNWYRIELSSSSETFNIPNYMYEPVNGSLIVYNDSNTLWYNISAGTTHSGENTNIVLLDSRIFTRICIKFKKPVDYKTPNQLNIQKISEVCRDINQARKE